MTVESIMPARMCQGRWFWTGLDDEFGKLELYIPDRNTHPEVVIEARIDWHRWEVKENGVVVAMGELKDGDPLWREGDGPQLEAERVICYGASALDTLRVQAYEAAAATLA